MKLRDNDTYDRQKLMTSEVKKNVSNSRYCIKNSKLCRHSINIHTSSFPKNLEQRNGASTKICDIGADPKFNMATLANT
jgi:hypothetical protein